MLPRIDPKGIYYRYFFSDEEVIKRHFKKAFGRKLNLDNPIRFNEKIQWLKLNWYDPLATKCADKYEVRSFVQERIGDKYLNDLYGVYDSVDEIDIDGLPDAFVLKATHGSGWNIICKDKNSMNWDKELKKMKRWLKTNYYWGTREWVYRDIKPRAICERYLSGENGNPPDDYKIFCFNGEPKIIRVIYDRFTPNHGVNHYDVKWNLINIEWGKRLHNCKMVEKPKTLDVMLDLSKRLAKGFPHVRCDWYNIKDRIVFGELTFFPANGMKKIDPEEFEIEMGSWLVLPDNRN